MRRDTFQSKFEYFHHLKIIFVFSLSNRFHPIRESINSIPNNIDFIDLFHFQLNVIAMEFRLRFDVKWYHQLAISLMPSIRLSHVENNNQVTGH